jgi:hypothetical protein
MSGWYVVQTVFLLYNAWVIPLRIRYIIHPPPPQPPDQVHYPLQDQIYHPLGIRYTIPSGSDTIHPVRIRYAISLMASYVHHFAGH